MNASATFDESEAMEKCETFSQADIDDNEKSIIPNNNCIDEKNEHENTEDPNHDECSKGDDDVIKDSVSLSTSAFAPRQTSSEALVLLAGAKSIVAASNDESIESIREHNVNLRERLDKIRSESEELQKTLRDNQTQLKGLQAYKADAELARVRSLETVGELVEENQRLKRKLTHPLRYASVISDQKKSASVQATQTVEKIIALLDDASLEAPAPVKNEVQLYEYLSTLSTALCSASDEVKANGIELNVERSRAASLRVLANSLSSTIQDLSFTDDSMTKNSDSVSDENKCDSAIDELENELLFTNTNMNTKVVSKKSVSGPKKIEQTRYAVQQASNAPGDITIRARSHKNLHSPRAKFRSIRSNSHALPNEFKPKRSRLRKASPRRHSAVYDSFHRSKGAVHSSQPSPADIVAVDLAVDHLKKRFAQMNVNLGLHREHDCLFRLGTKRLHLRVQSGKLMVRLGGGYAELLEFLDRTTF